MPISRDADVAAHERFGNFMQGLATPSRGAHEVMVWRTRVAPGGGPPVHKHDHEEVVVIVSGTGTFEEADGTVQPFGPGDTLLAPAGTVHELIADMVGCARETVTRAFDELQREGFVARREGSYQLLVRPESL